jgi:1-acyl-sn-glycerol-3-phosphate acyltransferase
MAQDGPRIGLGTWLLRQSFSWMVVRPAILLGLGLKVRHRDRLPTDGPAILAANHNSHLDTMVLMSLLPYRALPRVRPVAAADYFLANPLMAWFSTRVIGILPVHRDGGGGRDRDPLAGAAGALAAGEIVIIFPEGTRGLPEHMAEMKTGVAHLAKRFPRVPVVPVFLHGLGKTLPRGAWLPVPFFVDVVVGEAMYGRDDHRGFVAELEAAIRALGDEIYRAEWS